MANIFLTSDTHFGHGSMLKFRVVLNGVDSPMRPFQTVEEMDETLVERWNKVVKPSDKIYHLGDVTMNKKMLPIMSRLNGHKRLVRGNHDDAKTSAYLQYFDEVYATRKLDDFLLSHIPVHPLSIGKSKANCHGHIHNNGNLGYPYINLCVEETNYTPLELSEVKKIAEQEREAAEG